MYKDIVLVFLNQFKMHYLWEFGHQKLLSKLFYEQVSSAD